MSTSNHVEGNRLHFTGISDSTLARYVNTYPNRYSTIEAQQNFNNRLKIGNVENKLLFGLDYFHYNARTSYAAVAIDTVNFKNPGRNYNDLTKQALDGKDFLTKEQGPTNIHNTYGAYISDVITMNKRWTAMASARLDRYENRGTHNQVTDEVT